MSILNNRRNKIVHEMDILNKNTWERNKITKREVENYINLIEKLMVYIIDNI